MFFSLIHIFIVAIFTDFYTFDFFPFLSFRSVFLSPFFFFCRHVFLLCLFLGVSLIFSCSDLLSDGNPFACPVSLSPLCLFHGFSAFCAFLFVTFLFLNLSAWIFLHGFGFWLRTFFTWRIIFFSSCSSLLFRSGAFFQVLGFSAFGIFPKDILFFLFRARLYSFLIPHVNAFSLLMLTCGLIGFVVGAYRDSFFPQSLQKVRSSFIYTVYESTHQVPVSTLRQSRFIRFAEIPHADCPSNPNTLPPCRLFAFKVCFRFFRNLCVFRGLSRKKGYFLLFKSLFHRFFSFALSLSFFRFSFRKIVFYVITFHFSLNTPLLFSLFYRFL